MRHKQTAISLLEILLCIAIMASIGMMAVRYFMITSQNAKVTHAITQIKTLTKASYEWLQAQRQADFKGYGNTGITLQKLIDAGLITKAVERRNPWGGLITVQPARDASYVRITLYGLPRLACLHLSRQLKSINHSTAKNQCPAQHSNRFEGAF